MSTRIPWNKRFMEVKHVRRMYVRHVTHVGNLYENTHNLYASISSRSERIKSVRNKCWFTMWHAKWSHNGEWFNWDAITILLQLVFARAFLIHTLPCMANALSEFNFKIISFLFENLWLWHMHQQIQLLNDPTTNKHRFIGEKSFRPHVRTCFIDNSQWRWNRMEVFEHIRTILITIWLNIYYYTIT